MMEPEDAPWCMTCVESGYTDGVSRCANHKCSCGTEYTYSTGTHYRNFWETCGQCCETNLIFMDCEFGIPPGQLDSN